MTAVAARGMEVRSKEELPDCEGLGGGGGERSLEPGGFDAALGTAGSRGLEDRELCELGLLYAALEAELSPPVGGAAPARAVHPGLIPPLWQKVKKN